jgi:hypothetical protein
MTNLTFDIKKLNKLKKVYAKSVEDGVESFDFEGNLILTAYAKYMIQYLEMQFERR